MRELEDEIHILFFETTREATRCIFETCEVIPKISPMIPYVLAIEVGEEPKAPTTEELLQKRKRKASADRWMKQSEPLTHNIRTKKMDLWCYGPI